MYYRYGGTLLLISEFWSLCDCMTCVQTISWTISEVDTAKFPEIFLNSECRFHIALFQRKLLSSTNIDTIYDQQARDVHGRKHDDETGELTNIVKLVRAISTSSRFHVTPHRVRSPSLTRAP